MMFFWQVILSGLNICRTKRNDLPRERDGLNWNQNDWNMYINHSFYVIW